MKNNSIPFIFSAKSSPQWSKGWDPLVPPFPLLLSSSFSTSSTAAWLELGELAEFELLNFLAVPRGVSALHCQRENKRRHGDEPMKGFLTLEHFLGWPRWGPRQICVGKSHCERELDMLQRLSRDFRQPMAQWRKHKPVFAFSAWGQGFWGSSSTLSLCQLPVF